MCIKISSKNRIACTLIRRLSDPNDETDLGLKRLIIKNLSKGICRLVYNNERRLNYDLLIGEFYLKGVDGL